MYYIQEEVGAVQKEALEGFQLELTAALDFRAAAPTEACH